MEFRILGPLQASQAGRVVPLGGAQQRAVLAILLLHANRVVSADAIADGLWGERLPTSAVNTVQGYISRLRKVLASGDGEIISHSPPGYILRVDPDRVDAHRFERLAREGTQAHANGEVGPAAELLREALALWSGVALADVEFNSVIQLERKRLDELRLTALEERIELDLALSRHADLIAELELLVSEHPFREGFRGQLMLALYRSGRQAEALEIYQQARRKFVEELGIEPGQPLRGLEQSILRQDDSLAPRDLHHPKLEGTRPADLPPMPSRPRPTRRRRPLLLAIGSACAIGGAVLLGLVLPRIVGGETAAAAFRPGTVLIDLKTGRHIAFLPPSRLASPRFPLYSGGHIWLFNSRPRSFVEIDPATGKVLTQFAPPDGMTDAPTSTPYAIDGKALWVGAGDDLVKMDIGLETEVDRFHLDKIVGQAGTAEGIAVGGGLVWIGRDVGRGQLVAVDPDTGELRHRFRNVVHHADLAYGGRMVWAADSAGVNLIDLTTNVVRNVPDLETVDLYFGPGSAHNVVAAGGGFGWTTNSVKGVVYKIDRGGRIVARYHTGPGATGASFSNGIVWDRNEDDGTVTGIEAVTGKRTAYRFGHPVGAHIVARGVLVAALQPGRTTEDVVGAPAGKVVRLFSQQGAFGEKSEPALEWDDAAAQIEFATCATLLHYPDKPGPAGLQLRPEAAAVMPALSRDKRTYTFTVRRGYRFSPPTNEPLTAETFRESIERALSPKLEHRAQGVRGSGYPLPGPFIVDDIKGEQAFRQGKARHISGLRASNERLSITLTRPSPDFLGRLAKPQFCPVPTGTPLIPGAANRSLGGSDEFSIPSAGPYYVADWRTNRYVILRRNPNYRGPRPHALDAIVLREGVDTAAAIDRIRNGRWDGIISSGGIGSEHLDPLLDPNGTIASRYGERASTGEQYVPAQLFQTGYLALNASRGPFADRTVRRAAAFAVDRAKLAAVWNQVPTDQLLPPNSPAFRDRRLYPLRTPSLEKAAALMRGRRFIAVMAILDECPPCLQEGQLVRAELGRIGIRVRLKAVSDNATATVEKLDILDSGLYGGPDNVAFLETLFSEGMPPSWVTPRVRQAVERVSRLSGNERQPAAATLADRMVVSSVPVLPDGNHVQGEFFGSTLGCRVFPPFGGGVDLAALCQRERP